MIRFCLFIFLTSVSFVFGEAKGCSFKKFTGKVLGKKVRLRTSPSLDGHIITQLNKGDLLLVLEDQDEFWAVQPPQKMKAYVFRSYILDNTVEANRVNIRLSPNVKAPIIGQLHQGDKINGSIASENNKWLEIDLPSNVHFYVSKEFVGYAAGADYFSSMEKRKKSAAALLEKAYTIYQEEIKTPFEQMSPKTVVDLLQKVISDYSDVPSYTDQAKQLIVDLQEKYLEKKMAYLEERSDPIEDVKSEQIFPEIELTKTNTPIQQEESKNFFKIADRMKFWEPVEQSLFNNWATFHNNKTKEDFYSEQRANAIILSGMIESYDRIASNRPGDFILKNKQNIPIAFLYSTKVNLEDLVGKEVKVLGAPRPNHRFAYPAYFVIDTR